MRASRLRRGGRAWVRRAAGAFALLLVAGGVPRTGRAEGAPDTIDIDAAWHEWDARPTRAANRHALLLGKSLHDVSDAHAKQLVARCDIRRAIAAHDTVESTLRNFDKVAKAIPSASGAVKAVNEGESAEMAKTALEQLESLNKWWVGRLGKDEKEGARLAAEKLRAYRLKRVWRKPTQMDPTLQSGVLGAVVRGTALKEGSARAKQLAEGLGKCLT